MLLFEWMIVRAEPQFFSKPRAFLRLITLA